MKTIVLLLLLASPLLALDAEAIRKLIKEPHDRENLVKELAIFPRAREYRITVESGETTSTLKPEPAVTAIEKTIRGRYLLTQVTFPDDAGPLTIVVGFDKPSGTFRKWVLVPDGSVTTSTGLPNFDNRTIAWKSDQPFGNPATTILALETHSDKQSSWRERVMQGDKVLWISRGQAVMTK